MSNRKIFRQERLARARREREETLRLRRVQRRFRAIVRRPSLPRLLGIGALAFCGTVAVGVGWPWISDWGHGEPTQRREHLSVAVEVIDGDTLRLGEERIRIANIDTPEAPPRARCAAEAILAGQATANLKSMIGAAYEVDFIPDRFRKRDVYGRRLGRVEVDGVDVGDALVVAGLAKRWLGAPATWC